MPRLLLLIAALLALLATACAGGPSSDDAAAAGELTPPAPSTTTTSTTLPETTTTSTVPSLSPLAELVTPLGSALYDPADHIDTVADPISMTIPALDIEDAPIDAVGVEDNGDMEIPGADAVGWYRYGPEPGEIGSAVLAAHISYNGSPGVFRYLTDLSTGDRFTVTYDDGSVRTFEVTEMAQYDKDELPFDRVFAKDGGPEVALITCGGEFNRSVRSYEDNIVAYAVPVTDA